MADVTAAASPLRRGMIDDMSLRNLSPGTQRSYVQAVASSADISAGRRTGLGWGVSARSKSIWCRREFPGRR